MSRDGRRCIAIGLAVTALTIVAIAMAAHVNSAYVYARVAGHPYFVVGLAAIMLAVAARLALARQALRVTAYVVAGLVALPAFGVVGADVLLPDFFTRASERGVLATSTAFELVAYQESVLFRSDILALRLRTRAGLLSREGDEIACFMTPERPLRPPGSSATPASPNPISYRSPQPTARHGR